jgi:hypothetical protein
MGSRFRYGCAGLMLASVAVVGCASEGTSGSGPTDTGAPGDAAGAFFPGDASLSSDATADATADAGAPSLDAAAPFDAGACLTVDPDDGSTAAAALTTGSLACSFDASKKRAWADAAASCAARGAGWRLPTKAEALRILQEPSLCRTGADASAAPIAWITWTTTCNGRERVWVVGGSGSASVGRTDLAASLGFYALCIR